MSASQSMASILPSIRCSDCGVDVELSMMGEHVCSKQSEPVLFPPTGTGQKMAKSLPEAASDRPPALKTTRPAPLPRLQTNATGRPSVSPNDLTPASSGRGSNAVSPISMSSGRLRLRAPSRGVTTSSRPRPPSPELTNLDCAFPPFPTKSSRSNTPVSDSRSQTSDSESTYVRAHAEPYNALSRRESASSSGTRKRSKTLGGGQDAAQTPTTTSRGRRPSLASVTAGARPGFKNAPPLPSPLNCVASGQDGNPAPGKQLAPLSANPPNNPSVPGKNDHLQPFHSPWKVDEVGNVGTKGLDREGGNLKVPSVSVGHNEESKILAMKDDMEKPSEPIKTAQEPSEPVYANDVPPYGMRRPPPIVNTWLKEREDRTVYSSEKPQGSQGRSQTFPRIEETSPALEVPNNATQRRPSESSVTSQPSWPLGPATHASLEKPLLQYPLSGTVSFSGHVYHSPSESASSYGSVNSIEQTSSSRSSQPVQDTEPDRAPDTNSTHGRHEVQEQEILAAPKRPLLDYDADSPTDPAFQNGRLTPVEPFGLHRTQTTPEPSPQPSAHATNDAEQDPKRRPLLRSRTTGGNKGQCRGCSKIIAANQKSVSSADGRLTGRYHKECFACTTCHNAFQTADFYVLKDQPYCAQHYHALNGSLCGSCGHGIEGQYLEATRSEGKGLEKFHTKCFTCVMCRVVLKHDYFAHHGRFFCEQDIHRVATPRNRSPNDQSPGSGRGGSSFLNPVNGMPRSKFPERRSTKLMIMS